MEVSEALWLILKSIWDHQLFQTGLLLSSPFLLRHLLLLFGSVTDAASGKKGAVPVPQTRWQKAARWSAMAFAVLELYRAWGLRSTDVFCEVRPLADDAAFKWHFQRYVDRQAAADPAGFRAEEAEWIRSRQAEGGDGDGAGRVRPAVDPELGAEPATGAARLLTLREVLAKGAARKTYRTFGEDAALRCPWCSGRDDYVAFHLPTRLHYVLAAAVVGAATVPRRKHHWRAPLVAALLAAAGIDLCVLLVDDADFIVRELPCSTPTKLAWFRHGVFAALALALAAARGRDDVRTDADVAAALCGREELLHRRGQASAMLRAAVKANSSLREAENEHHCRREAERNLLAADEEVASATERAKERVDFVKITADVEAYVAEVVRVGVGINKGGT